MHSRKLADMMEVIKKNGYKVDSVLIIRNGYIVLDAYFYPFSKGQRHVIHSSTKSIMSALVVSAFKDNKCIYLVVHPMLNPEKFADLVESLRFE